MRLMKKALYYLSASVLLLIGSISAYAQQNNLRTAYFLDGYTYRYKLNPALAPERGFFAFPALGNLGIGAESNLALSTFLYPTTDGKMATFLDDRVSAEEFDKKIRKRNNLNVNTNLSILSFGFRTGEAFHTVDLSVKANVGANIPGELFSFAKTGTENGATSWDISDLGMRGDAYAELAYGFSRSIGESIRVGGRLKLLMGYASADVALDRLSLTVSEEQWAVKSHGDAMISGPFTIGTESGSNKIDFSRIETPEDMEGFLSPLTTHKSMGAALDLGFSYDFLDYFTVSASILDLGYIKWNNVTEASTPEGSWSFDGLGEIDINEDNTLGDQFGQMGEELMGMVELYKTSDGGKKSKGLGATFHAGIEARMPFYERLTFGLLASHRFRGAYSWTEGRLSMNLAPLKFFSVAASYAYSNYGGSLGGVVNIHLPGFNLYAGVDSFSPLLDMTPQYVPVGHINTNLVFGLNFSFGKPAGRYHDVSVE